MSLRALVAFLAVAFACPPARAHSVADELTLGASEPTATNPAAAWYVSDRLSGAAEIKSFTLHLDTTYTYDASVPPSPCMKGDTSCTPAHFDTSSANIFLFSLGLDWDINDHFSVGIAGNYSPPSTLTSDAQIAYATVVGAQDVSTNLDTQLVARSTSGGGSLFFGYDTAGDSNHETMVDASAGFTWFSTTQKIQEYWSPKRMMDLPASDLLKYCNSHPMTQTGIIAQRRTCTPQTRAALKGEPASLGELRLGASFTETVYQDTDIGLNAAYYIYTTDPTTVGYFSSTTRGRVATRTGTLGRSETTNFGEGISVMPFLYTVQPAITQRYKGFSAALSFQFGQYVTGTNSDGSPTDYSYDLMLGVKLQYKFNKAFRLWLKGSGQRDVDSTGQISYSGYAALGAKYKF